MNKRQTYLKRISTFVFLFVLLVTQMSMDNLHLFTNTLTVELNSFDANMTDDQGVVLTWSTVGVDGHSKFIVEKSLDGFSFQKIGEVMGLGAGSQQYFQEDQFFEWKAYYRLKQVGQDGSAVYSNTVFIENTNFKYRFDLYPNPIKNDQILHLKYSPFAKSVSTVLIYDHIGKLYMKVIEGNIDQINIEKLPTGHYILAAISSDGHRETKRFVVVEY